MHVADYYSRSLQLLGESAPISRFEELLADIRSHLSDPVQAQMLINDVNIAIRLRENFEHKRKRESELSALNETARDLSSLRDTDQILRAIVQRARQLVSADIAYLSVADPVRDEYHVRATEGVISLDFARIRVPSGIGVCGQVARTRRPFYSSNYCADTQFGHERDIDRAIQAEGVVSILGIPLELESKVIGVLFVADRYVRTYMPQEMSVLSSLSTFAALAIENARLLEEARRALATARQTNAELERKAQAIEEAAVAHEQLTELIARGGSLDDLVARVSSLLKGKACIVDERRQAICGELPQSVGIDAFSDAVRQGAECGRAVQIGNGDGSVSYVAVVIGGAPRASALVLTRDGRLAASEMRTLERGAIAAAIVLLSHERVAQIAYRNVTDMLSALLRGIADPFSPENARRLSVGSAIAWPITVLLIELDDRSPSTTSAAARSLRVGRDTIFAEFNSDLVAVTNAPDPRQLATRISDELHEAFGGRFSIVISGPIPALHQVTAQYEALRRGLRLLRGLNQKGRIAFESTLTVYSLMFYDKADSAIEAFIKASIGPILEHDERRKGQLAATLLAFLDGGRNIQKAAATLDIHVNTVRQRLDAIAQLTADWLNPERALDIHIALRLHALSRSVSSI